MSSAIAGPLKRKRSARSALDEGESDIVSTEAVEITIKRKKSKYQPADESDDDDGTDYVLSTAESVADSHTATTFAESNTPLTEASSAGSRTKARPKKYLCTFPDCNKAFDRPVRLQTHINSHTGTRPHVCPEGDCDKSFFKVEHLTRHMKEKHSEESFECEHPVYDDFMKKLVPCGKKFESANKLKRHVAMHEDKEDTTCTWEGCGKVFRKQDTLQRHIKKDHLNEDSYLCHRELPDGSICGHAFPTPGQLRGHEAREHNAPKYVCEICTNAMMMLPETVPQLSNDLDPEFLPTAEDLGANEEALEPQIMRGLSLDDVQPVQLQYQDNIVGFATYHDLQRHNKFTHPPICTQCGKKCRSSKDLTAHMDIMHPPSGTHISVPSQPDKRFLCPYRDCARSTPGNGFTKKGNMDVHVKSTHTKERNFVCGTYDLSGNKKVEGWTGSGCGMAMQTKQALIGHIRTQHIGVPAALGARTGLKDKDRTRWIQPKEMGRRADDHEMDIDSDLEPAASKRTISMMTGSGYDELRPIACLTASGPEGCKMRFTNDYELGSHLELTHGWNVDDINDALEARADTQAGAEAMESDAVFRHKLEMQLGGGGGQVNPQSHELPT